MTALRALTCLAAVIAVMTWPVLPASAASSQCSGSAETLEIASAECETSAEDVAVSILTSSGSDDEWKIVPLCEYGDDHHECPEQLPCTVNGLSGFTYNVFHNGVGVGSTCLTPGQADMLEAASPGLVLREFQRLGWPASSVVIQPPDGETLVNFATNFLTTNTEPTQQTVTLLGLPITIEATPATYTWIHGDGTEQTTSSPGDFYPAGDVFHEYRTAEAVAPSVDTTYSGRFRIRDSAWYDIPATVTVVGPSVPLTVREARPQLTGAD